MASALIMPSTLVVASALAEAGLLSGGGGLSKDISAALPGYLPSPDMDGPITLPKS